MARATLNELRRIMTTLDSAQFNFLVRGTLDWKMEWTTETTLQQQLVLGLAEWLAHLGCVTDGQQRVILSIMAKPLECYAEKLEPLLTDRHPKPFFLISLADGRYATYTGCQRWFDLQECNWIDELPEPAVSHLCCDLTALSQRQQRRLNFLRKGSPDAIQPSAVLASDPDR